MSLHLIKIKWVRERESVSYSEELLCSRDDMSDNKSGAEWKDDVLIIGM